MEAMTTTAPAARAARSFIASPGVFRQREIPLSQPLQLRQIDGILWAYPNRRLDEDTLLAEPVTNVVDAGRFVFIETAQHLYLVTAGEYRQACRDRNRPAPAATYTHADLAQERLASVLADRLAGMSTYGSEVLETGHITVTREWSTDSRDADDCGWLTYSCGLAEISLDEDGTSGTYAIDDESHDMGRLVSHAQACDLLNFRDLLNRPDVLAGLQARAARQSANE